MSDNATQGSEHSSPREPHRGTRIPTRALVALAGALALVAGGLAVGLLFKGKPSESLQINCGASPSSCGYPSASSTGPQAGVTLRTVPGDVSSGPGWSFDSRGFVSVTGSGAVLSGLYIPYNVNVAASNVTLQNDKIVVGGLSAVAVSLRHASGVTIQNCTLSGKDTSSGRMMTGVKDIYGDSAGAQVLNDNIAMFETAVQMEVGLIQDNYIHDPGYIAGDHTNGIMSNGGKTGLLAVNHNTVFNSRGQTDAVALFEDFGVQTNRTVTNNLLAGGGYAVYAGQTASSPVTSNLVFKSNKFSTIYFAKSGNYGPGEYFNANGAGNVWSGNTWDVTGLTVPAP